MLSRAKAAAALLPLFLAGACVTPLPGVPFGAPSAPPAATATGSLRITADGGATVAITQGLGGESATAVQIEAAFQRGFDEGRDSARPGAAWQDPGEDVTDPPDCDCQTAIDEAYGQGYDNGHREARTMPPLEPDCSSGKCHLDP